MTGKTLTRNQGLVHAHLVLAGRAMSAYDLLNALRGDGLRAPVQVYRALEKLTASGLVHRIESLNSYVACDRAKHDSAVAFAICDACGAVNEFTLPAALEPLASWAEQNNFRTRQTTIEIAGLCYACASDGAPEYSPGRGPAS